MAQGKPFSGDWSNALAGPGVFPAVSRDRPGIFPVGVESSQPGNADVITGYTTPFRWRADTPFDAMQVQRELIFVMPWDTGDFPDQPRFLSLGQVNLILRDSWNKYQDLQRVPQAKRVGLEYALATNYMNEGEDVFEESDATLYGNQYRQDEKMKRFCNLGRMAIMSQYRLWGVKKTSASSTGGLMPDRSCTTVHNGRGIVVNYWKDANVGDDLWVVLRKEENGPYQFIPWCGRGSPKSDVLCYTDVSGKLRIGGKYRVGQVTRGNHLTASEKRRLIVLGIGANTTLEAIKHEAESVPTLDINVAIGDDM
jgi:hypothetical protein